MSETNGFAAGSPSGGQPDPERLLDTAARLVLAGKMPSACRLARHCPCSVHFAMQARADLLNRRRWPYRARRLAPGSRPNPGEVREARLRLGLAGEDVVVAEPVTPAALACAQYRREWRGGHNFLDGRVWTDEDD